MNKAVFLDRDGTINVDKHYLHRISDFEFIPGVLSALKRLQDAGYLLVIITNQSGIGRGYYTEADFHVLNNWMLKELSGHGIRIARVYYCPHLPDAQVEAYRLDCNCRKPALGMFEQAVRELDIDLAQSWAVGDKLRDCAICSGTECRGILIGENEKPERILAAKTGKLNRIWYADHLEQAAQKICKATGLEE